VLREANARGGDIGAAHVLRRYERERRSENAMAARGLDLISNVFDSSNSAVSAMRGLGLAVVDRTQLAKQLCASIAAGRM
jgi:2-octaprenylphenol hydroxylase